MESTTRLLGGLDPAGFLERHWQKRPLLLRGALAGWESPLSAAELAGLACEDEVASRIVLETGGAHPWEVRHGPFDASDFAGLSESRWTLLVEGVDRLVPEVGRLLERFRFIPNWRLDDVMVSYATPQGGVGAHVDNYDVFLLQGSGTRHWSIEETPLPEGREKLLPGTELRLLESFEPTTSWVLEPGDMLYLPPRIPHLGVARDAGMTYSIGFRAPSRRELVAGWLAHVLEASTDGSRFADPDLTPAENPGEITRGVISRVATIARGSSADDETFEDWFGTFVTRVDDHVDEETDEKPPAEWLVGALRAGAELERVGIPRLAFISREDGSVKLYACGRRHLLEPELAFAAPLLCGAAPLDAETLGPHLENPGLVELLRELLTYGCLELSS